MELHAVAAVLRGFGQAEAFLQLDVDHGALARPIDLGIAAGGHGQALRCELVQAGGFGPGEQALQGGVHVYFGGGGSRGNLVQLGPKPLGGIGGIDFRPGVAVVRVQVAEPIF